MILAPWNFRREERDREKIEEKHALSYRSVSLRSIACNGEDEQSDMIGSLPESGKHMYAHRGGCQLQFGSTSFPRRRA